MRNLLALPPSLLLTLSAHLFRVAAQAAYSSPTVTPVLQGVVNGTFTIAPTGNGSSYANACWSAYNEYNSASSSWTEAYNYVSTMIQTFNSTSVTPVTYYENATTLCDGHPRVTYSPAIPTSTGNTTQSGFTPTTSISQATYGWAFNVQQPNCSVSPQDCDPLWVAYTASVSAAGSMITASPIQTPPCANQSQASINAAASRSVYGCGECTIYGEGVQLVFFPPTSASRDMCATTPSGTVTHYGPGAVLTAYAGKNFSGDGNAYGSDTVVADGHTFTSGTAYISISTVWAVNRCSSTFGTPINDAILAMPSESILSLRFSQNHFQRFQKTDRVTGYPVSYADFSSPVPWSAWVGQNICDPGGNGGSSCSIVYENDFRPQLAIPPEITLLSPAFNGCQLWYNGLWDPPLALQKQTSADGFSPPGHYATSTAAAPSSTPAAPTVSATAQADNLPTTTSRTSQPDGLPRPTGGSAPTTTSQPNELPRPTGEPVATMSQPDGLPKSTGEPVATTTRYVPESEPWTHSFQVGGHTFSATAASERVTVDGATIISGGPSQTITMGIEASYGSNGLELGGSSTIHFNAPGPASGTVEKSSITATITATIAGQIHTVIQSSSGGPIVVGDLTTLTPGGAATTLSNGETLSAASNSLVIDWTSTLGNSASTSSAAAGSAPIDSASTDAATTASEGKGSKTSVSSRSTRSTASGSAQSATGSSPNNSDTPTSSAPQISATHALFLFTTILASIVLIGT